VPLPSVVVTVIVVGPKPSGTDIDQFPDPSAVVDAIELATGPTAVNQTFDVVLRAVPTQSLRARSK
jgi:hypothetical protein